MKQESFYGTETLETLITNRKKETNNESVSWLKCREIMLVKNKPFSLFMREDFDAQAIEVDIRKKTSGRPLQALLQSHLVPLWPAGKGIADVKLKRHHIHTASYSKGCIKFL
ncbi:hypothetical protein RI129_002868 [Pyrocoelia pectoralis]|uniref:Uncharacterized protein n=1 Tax=Pyrocoelia pectoralis TaxID=417401 RepID=A0AAN7ZTW3_9COLE